MRTAKANFARCARRFEKLPVAALAVAVMMAVGATGCTQGSAMSVLSTPSETSGPITSVNAVQGETSSIAAPVTPGASGQEQQFVVPEAAKAHTKEGAVAFVTFYWNMLGELNAHPRTGIIPMFAAEGCRACQRQEESVVSFVQRGIRVEDRGAALTRGTVRADSIPDSVVVQFHQTSKGAEKYVKGKRAGVQAPINNRIELRADWTGGEWKLGEEGSLGE